MSAVAVELMNVRKTFGPTIALDRVNLRAYEGEVHAIVGGNGSGKSTLAKVVSGVLAPDSGQVSIFGKSAANPSESKALGIANVYQEVLVADECSVLDNLFLGTDGLFGKAEPYEERRQRAHSILYDLLGFDLNPDTIVGNLPLSIKQWITIARGILTDPRLLILDESSAALDFESTERLFAKMRELKASGCAIFIVTHRIAELVRIADRATILRDGVSVGELSKDEITEENILELIAGKGKESTSGGQVEITRKGDVPILCAEKIRVWHETAPFDFNLYPGEVVGVTGLDGQGQADFVRVLAGVKPLEQGRIHLIRNGIAEPIIDLRTARENGISYVSGDRKKEGIFPNLSIIENMCLSIYYDYSAGWFFNFLNHAKLIPIFEHETAQLTTKMGDPGNLITSLSGGNQQKILIARAFSERPNVLILNDPARGIDIAAKLDLYRNLRKFTERGNAVVFLSSEIEEFLDLCNRVLVFRGGVVSSNFEAPFDPNIILNATFGRKSSGAPLEESNRRIVSLDSLRPIAEDGRPNPRSVRLRPNIPRRIKMNQSGFLLTSPDIVQGGTIPERFAESNRCSPALEWEGVPEGTESFALAIVDPDLPPEFKFPRSFAHWLVYDIPPDARHLSEGASMTSSMPANAQELNSDFVTFNIPGFGRGYAGPWPPDRKHRYVFTLYALKTRTLDLPRDGDLAAFATAVLPVTIDQTSLTATYGPAKAALPAA